MIFYIVLILFLLSLIVDGYLFGSRVNIYQKMLIFLFLISIVGVKIGFEAFNEPAIDSKDKDISFIMSTEEFNISYHEDLDKYVNHDKKLGANRIEIYGIVENLFDNDNTVKLDNEIVCIFISDDYLDVKSRLGFNFLNKEITIQGDVSGLTLFDEIALINCVLID